MAASDIQLYKAHVKNLRAVDTAFERIVRELNASLARGDHKTADALLKTAMLLLGGWAENRLKKLLYEPNGFSGAHQASINSANSQLESWKVALEHGFRKRHNLRSANLLVALPLTPRSHYIALVSTLETELRPIIEVRNKLAHGQWVRALNSENTDFAPLTVALINGENAHTIKCKKRVLSNLAMIIHDLIAGNHAFERDIDTHFRHVEDAKRDISNRSYEAWLLHMRAKLSRGKQARSARNVGI
jgi:ribosomal protein L20